MLTAYFRLFFFRQCRPGKPFNILTFVLLLMKLVTTFETEESKILPFRPSLSVASNYSIISFSDPFEQPSVALLAVTWLPHEGFFDVE